MTTTDKIIEAIRKKLIGVEETATYVGLIENLLPDIRTAIDSVIGEQPKIDLEEVENLITTFIHPAHSDHWRKAIGYTLADLTQKTKEDGK